MYFTYIVYSKQLDRYYIGHTDDLLRRIGEHRNGKSPYTSQARDWVFVFYESFVERSGAMELETRIKRSKSRKTICRYIHDSRNEKERVVATELV